MLKKYGILAIAVIGCALSCVQKEDKGIERVTFQAVHADSPASKTVLQADGSVFWSTGDAINLFYGEGGAAKLTSANKDAAAQTTFTGTLDGMLPNGTDEFWAVYPYAAGNSFDGSAVTLTLPSEQTGVAGTFANELFISLARSKDYTLQFYNLCGGIKFSVSQQGIQSVVFQGNDGEILAGQVQVAFDDNGKPAVKELVKGATELRLSAPEGGFEVGKWYYIVSLPDTLSAGYTMVFLDANSEVVAQRVTDTPVTIKRSVWGRLTNADFIDTGEQPDNEIWYTTSDGNTIEYNLYPNRPINATIVSNTYENNKGIIKFDKPITSIGYFAFSGRETLETISIPGGVELIDEEAFHNCSGLQWPEIPSSVSKIGDCAFWGCDGLTQVTIPETVTELGHSVFQACHNIESFSGNFASADGRCLVVDGVLNSFAHVGLGDEYVFPQGITVVGDGALRNNWYKGALVFGNTLKSIGEEAFAYSYYIKSVALGDNLESVADGAFIMCGADALDLPESLSQIGNESFAASFDSLVFHSVVPPIASGAFFSSDFLTNKGFPVYVPAASVDGYKAAEYWSAYADWIRAIPEGVQPDNEIWYTSSDGAVVIPNDANVFGAELVSNTYENGKGIMRFNGPVTKLGDKSSNSSQYAPFSNCQKLVTVSLPESVDTISLGSFYSCIRLKSVSMPSHLSYLGSGVFTSTAIESIHIPETDEFSHYMNPIGGYTPNLSSITGPYASADERCFVVDGRLLAFAPAGLESYLIDDGITMIGTEAFSGSSELREITLPSSLKTIRNQSFTSCSSLEGVEFPDGLESIDYAAFAHCYSLQTITIPANTTITAREVFDDCLSLHSFAGHYATEDGRLLVNNNIVLAFAPGGLKQYSIPEGVINATDGFGGSEGLPELESLTLPSSLETLRLRASSLKTLVSNASVPPSISSSYYLDLPAIDTVFVPAASVDAYKAALGWSSYTEKIQPLENSVTASKYLTFTSEGLAVIALENEGGNAPVLYYSENLDTWTQWDYDTLHVKPSRPIYICGDNPNGFSVGTDVYSKFTATGDSFSVSGDIMSLINKDTDVLSIPSQSCFTELFRGCEGLLSAPSLPATTLTDKCYFAMFYSCSGLMTAPALPATTLGTNCYTDMFRGCSSLTAAPELPATTMTNLCYAQMFMDCTSLVAAPALPATVLAEECYSGMFQNCTSLQSAPELPATVLKENCYNRMFAGCSSLTEAPALPATTLAVGCYSGMFSVCSSLTDAPVLPAATLVEDCYSDLFFCCYNLNYVKCLATDVTATNCLTTWLASVSVQGTFVKAASMNDWTIGESGIPQGWTVEDAGQPNNEIWYTSTTGEAVIPADNAYFGADLVSNTYENGKGVITFDGDVTTIGDDAFWTSNQEPGTLKTISLPESCTSIGMSAFQFQSAIEEFGFPETLQSIGALAFYGCTALPSVSLYNTLTEIGDFAFGACDSLKQVAIPHTVQVMGNSVFAECKSLERFDGLYADASGRALINGNKLLAIAPAGLTTYTIPDGVTIIGGSVFKACANFLEINIPEGVTQINMVAFDGCTGLSSITIPSSMQSMGENAFSNCTGLESIFVMATNPPAGGNNMFDSTNECPIFVPSQSLADYQAATYWNLYSERIQGMQ